MAEIKIIDYGSQYTHLIKCRFRELGYDADILDADEKGGAIENAKALVLSGGPNSVYQEGAPQLNEALIKLIFQNKIPTLAICYGMQLICEYLAQNRGYSAVKSGNSGETGADSTSEYGKATLTIHCGTQIFKDIPSGKVVWMSHGDYVDALPTNSHLLASTNSVRCAAVALINHPVYCLQFHPEVSQTTQGQKILRNFLDICGISPNWDNEKTLEEIKKETLAKIGERHVLAFVSGGKDSGVLATFLKALLRRERLTFVYVSGLDPPTNEQNLKLIDENIVIVNARQRFFSRLENVHNPEEKRRVIGKVFAEIWQEQTKKMARELGIGQKDFVLAQGTIYPDVIESGGSKRADTIKSHHNRVKEIQELLKVGLVVEPFSNLFKEDIRKIGKVLGLDARILAQHPRPGPSDAIRIICSPGASLPSHDLLGKAITAERDIQAICRAYGYDAWLLPVKTKGVKGDQSTYSYTIALIGEYRRNELLGLAGIIPNKFGGTVNRVLYASSPKDTNFLGLMGLRKCGFNPETKKIADNANSIFIKNLHLANIYNFVSQAFVVIAPLSFDGQGYSAVIRTVDTYDFMTASCHWLPAQFLERVSDEILQKIPQIQLVLYDLTSKPPATIEWE